MDRPLHSLELLGPLLALLSGLPPLTLAWLLMQRQPNPVTRAFFRGLAVLTLTALALALGGYGLQSAWIDPLWGRAALGLVVFAATGTGLSLFRHFLARLRGQPPRPSRRFVLYLSLGVPALGLLWLLGPGETGLWAAGGLYAGGLVLSLRPWQSGGLTGSLPEGHWFARLVGRLWPWGPLVGGLTLAGEAGRALGLWPLPTLLPYALALFFMAVSGSLAQELASVAKTFESGGPSRAALAADLIAARCLASPLSRREGEVLKALLEGLSNRDLAAALNIREATAKNHVYNLFQKIGVSSRAELLALAAGASVEPEAKEPGRG